MKKLIIIFISCFTINNLKAEADSLICLKDSSYYNEMLDSCLLQQEVLVMENKPFEIMKKAEIKKLSKLAKPANWFSDAWDAFTDLFKPVWGHYTEDGFRSEGPYFIFDRNIDGPTYVQIQMQQVQDKIK